MDEGKEKEEKMGRKRKKEREKKFRCREKRTEREVGDGPAVTNKP